MGIPSEIKKGEGGYATFLNYSSFSSMEAKLNAIRVEREEIKRILEKQKSDIEEYIEVKDEEWLGKPLPESYRDALARNKFLLMDEYRKIHEEKIKPIIQDILLKSQAEFSEPRFKYNDLGIGMFDFSRASVNLLPRYQYYSIKKKQIVEFKEVTTKQEKDGKFGYLLKTDKSKVIIIPELTEKPEESILNKMYVDIDKGARIHEIIKKYKLKVKFYSTIKKSYLWKEKVPKPKNAIRLFILIGGNANKTGEQLMYTGITAISLAELLEYFGYTVSIVCCFGTRRSGLKKADGEIVSGHRMVGFEIKKFTETSDSESLLYVTADASFFRVKIFRFYALLQERYNDNPDGSLGSMPDNEALKKIIFNNYGIRDGLFFVDKNNPNRYLRDANSTFLYYFIGNVYNEDSCTKAIRDIALEAENENNLARQQLGYSSIHQTQEA